MEEALDRGRQLINRLELIQYQFFNGRPEWTNIQFENLKLFMAYTYYGSPFNEVVDEENNDVQHDNVDNMTDNIFDYYKEEEKQKITEMINIVYKNIVGKNVTHIQVGFTIIHSICKMQCNVCQDFPTQDIHQWFLLRIKLDFQRVAYVDLLHGRTYKDWNDYIENNTLPKGFMFYPELGVYDESAYLTQNLTPPSRKSERILNSVDKVGKVTTFASGLLLGCGLIFPIMTPLVLPAAVATGSSSVWEVGRQICKLSDLGNHNESLVNKKAVGEWVNLAIATLGVITAPLNAAIRTLELSNSAIMTTRIGKSLSVIQKGACITQCSLEVLRFTTNILNNNKQVSLKDIISLRLDLFIITGSLLPLQYIVGFIECIVTKVWRSSLYTIVVNLPICVGKYIYTASCFVQKQLVELCQQMEKFLKDKLTAQKLMFALKNYCEFITSYKKQLSVMNTDNLLTHIINDTGLLPCYLSNEVKNVLCGDRMKSLIQKKCPEKATDRNFVKFCIELVMEKAQTLRLAYTEAMTECKLRGLDNISNIEHEFCLVYGLNQCDMSVFVLNGIQQIADDTGNLMNAYEQHCLQPENKFNEVLMASHTEGSQTIQTFSTVPPCNKLDVETCTHFAQTYDQRNHEYNSYRFMQPQQDVSVLYSASSFSVNMVIFVTNTDNGIPSLNVSFYRDSQASLNNRLQ